MDKHTKELINRSLDGDLSEPEKAELDSLLGESEEARAYQQEMSGLVDYLESTEPVHAPQGLERSILGKVDLPHPRRWFTWAAGWMQGRPVAYGTGAALGLLATIAFYELTPAVNSPRDLTGLVGTISTGTDSRDSNELASLVINAPGIKGTASLERKGELVFFNVDLDSEEITKLHAKLPESGLVFEGFSNESDEPLAGLLIASRNVSVSDTRFKKFSVIYSRPEGADPLGEAGIQLVITQDRKIVYRGVLNR